MAGRPKRDYEVKSYLVRLTPALIDRIEYCCSLLDVATKRRLPRNTRLQHALEQWCERVEAQQTPSPTPAPITVPPLPLVPPATVHPEELSSSPLPLPPQPPQSPPTPRTRAQKKEEMDEVLQRILAARETYDRLNLDEFAQLLFDRDIYKALDRRTREEKPVNTGTLSRWLRQGGMT